MRLYSGMPDLSLDILKSGMSVKKMDLKPQNQQAIFSKPILIKNDFRIQCVQNHPVQNNANVYISIHQTLVNNDLISLHLLLIMVCNFCKVFNV